MKEDSYLYIKINEYNSNHIEHISQYDLGKIQNFPNNISYVLLDSYNKHDNSVAV